MSRVYLDMCCLKRPFDDQGQPRIRREARAVSRLLERVESGELEAISSPALAFENDRNPREDRRLATAVLLGGLTIEARNEPRIETRARELAAEGFGPLDSLHVAFAEAAAADWLATCDDDLLRLARTHAGALRVRIANPCDLTEEP